MKLRGLKIASIILVCCVIFSFVIGCDRSVSIEISGYSSVEILKELSLSAKVFVGGKEKQSTVEWSVEDKTDSNCGATISSGGVLKAQRTGYVIVTASSRGQTRTKEVQIIPMSLESELSYFDNYFGSLLSLTTTTVEQTHFMLIEQARAYYYTMSAAAMLQRIEQKTHIDTLYNELSARTAVENFKTDHDDILKLTASTITLAHRQKLEEATTIYDLLSALAKSRLTLEGELLAALSSRMDKLVIGRAEADEFLVDFASLLALTKEDIVAQSEEGLIVALVALDALSEDGQAFLSSELAHLTSLYEMAGAVKLKDEFLSRYGSLFELSFNSEQTSAEEFVEDYRESVFNAVQYFEENRQELVGELIEEYIVPLFDLKERIIELEEAIEEAREFLSLHEEAFGLIVDNVELESLGIVELALEEFAALSEDAKEILKAQKQVLDSVRLELAQIEADSFRQGIDRYDELLTSQSPDDFSAILTIMSQIDELSAIVRNQLSADYSEFSGKLSELGELTADQFRIDYGVLLALAEEDITMANKDVVILDVEYALSIIYGYHQIIQENLLNEIERLNALKAIALEF